MGVCCVSSANKACSRIIYSTVSAFPCCQTVTLQGAYLDTFSPPDLRPFLAGLFILSDWCSVLCICRILSNFLGVLSIPSCKDTEFNRFTQRRDGLNALNQSCIKPLWNWYWSGLEVAESVSSSLSSSQGQVTISLPKHVCDIAPTLLDSI